MTGCDNKPLLDKLWTRNFIHTCVVNLILYTGYHMLVSTFPFFIVSLGGDEAVAGLTAGLFAVFSVAARPIAGWMLDNQGRRRLLVFGVAGMVMMPGFYWLGLPLWLAILLRMFQGSIWSCASTAVNTVACDKIPPSRLAEGMGYFGLANALANAIAPAVGLGIMYRYGFGTLFGSNLGLLALGLALILQLSVAPLPRDRFRVALRHSLRTLLNKEAVPASVTMLCFLLPHGAVLNFVAMYASRSHVGNGGLFFACMAATTALMRLSTGRIADRRGERPLLYASLACQFAALLLLAFCPAAAAYLCAALLWGGGFGMMTPAMQAMAMRGVAPERRGSASSTFLASFDIGLGLGAAISGQLVKSFGYNAMFALMSLALLLTAGVYHFAGAFKPRTCRRMFPEAACREGSAGPETAEGQTEAG